MDSHDKTISWFGTVRDKFDSFCSDVDHIISQDPFQYAENQLFTAGANVKQFCSEFMEEMLPENIINSLKEKTCGAVEQLRTDIDQGPIKELSDDSSPILMEIVENEDTDSSLGTETSVGKEMCFEEIRIRQTTFASEISRIDIHCRNGKCNGGDGLPQSPLTRPAKERGLSEHIDRPSADFKVELSTEQTPSALSTEERRASDLNDQMIEKQRRQRILMLQKPTWKFSHSEQR